jgi:hypothetical protein
LKTIKSLSNYLLLILSLASFFTLNWTSSHIHIAKHHNHGGSYHKHQTQVHNHHLDNIDISSEHQHLNIIKIEYQSNLQDKQKVKKPTYIFSNTSYSLENKLYLDRYIGSIHNKKLSYLTYSKLNSRAPPKVS